MRLLKKIVSLKSVLRENNYFLSNVLKTKSAYLRNTLVSSCATLRRSAGKSDMISSIVTECVGSMAWLRSDSLLLWVHYSTDLSEQLLRGTDSHKSCTEQAKWITWISVGTLCCVVWLLRWSEKTQSLMMTAVNFSQWCKQSDWVHAVCFYSGDGDNDEDD